MSINNYLYRDGFDDGLNNRQKHHHWYLSIDYNKGYDDGIAARPYEGLSESEQQAEDWWYQVSVLDDLDPYK